MHTMTPAGHPSAADAKAVERIEGTIVVGAGPGGLAVGAALRELGLEATLLERGDHAGARWSTYYDGLRLNSSRAHSSLPGLKIEPGCGRWPTRSDMLVYLQRYASYQGLDIRTGVTVHRLSRDGYDWCLETTAGELRCRTVVLATGLHNEPVVPAWPGLEGFRGQFLHARDYVNAKPFARKDVLVVGCGTSGPDIALELLAIGAERVRMSVRTPPLIFRRQTLGIPTTVTARFVKQLPGAMDPLVDRVSLRIQSRFGDLSKFGLAKPTEGLATAIKSRGHGTLIDNGFVAAVRNSEIEIVPAVAAFDEADVVLADGDRVQPDVVVAATGQRPALEPLVGHLDVLLHNGLPIAHGDAVIRSARGLHFIGYRRLSGQLPDMGPDARKIARRIQDLTDDTP